MNSRFNLALYLAVGLCCWPTHGIASADIPDERSDVLPIVAVWAHPSDSSNPECGGECEFVKASYVKWLESVGVRSFPVRFDATPEELKPILDGVNGLFLPGGTPTVPDSARWAIKYAKALNDAGHFFPAWGTCVGWEWMAQALAGDFPVLTDSFDANNLTQPLGILPNIADESRMLSGFPDGLLKKASTEPLTTNQHHKGVTPEDFQSSGLGKIFRALAINEDRKGQPYMSAVEAFDYPMYGLQWHPEKSQFDWGLDPDGTPHYVISHTPDAIKLSQTLADFFSSELRRSSRRSFPDIDQWEHKMFHNLKVTPTGPSTGQRYFIHWESRKGENDDGKDSITLPVKDFLGSDGSKLRSHPWGSLENEAMVNEGARLKRQR